MQQIRRMPSTISLALPVYLIQGGAYVAECK